MFPLEERAPSPIDKVELVNQWLQQPEGDPPEPPFPIDYPELELAEYENEDKSVKEEVDSKLYREFVLKSPAYSWLVTILKREATLTRGCPDLMKDIESSIIAILPPIPTVSKKVSPPPYRATLKLDWDPLGFLREQQYSESPNEAVQHAITLTGCANDAQGLTTRQYLLQTWPTTGGEVMDMVASIVCSDPKCRSRCE